MHAIEARPSIIFEIHYFSLYTNEDHKLKIIRNTMLLFLLLFDYNEIKTARKSENILKENLVGCTGEGNR